MLVVGCHDPWCNKCSVWYRITYVYGRGGEDSCGADFVIDGPSLGELKSEYVFVISNCNNCLENEEARACYYGIVGSVVGMPSRFWDQHVYYDTRL
jgi:hypothetical protein